LKPIFEGNPSLSLKILITGQTNEDHLVLHSMAVRNHIFEPVIDIWQMKVWSAVKDEKMKWIIRSLLAF